MNYEKLFDLFDKKHHNINDTSFYFKSDPNETLHFMGYLSELDRPYWIGICDIEDGCNFKTAKELFEASVFEGRSIKDRWGEIVLCQIGGIAFDEWKELQSQI